MISALITMDIRFCPRTADEIQHDAVYNDGACKSTDSRATFVMPTMTGRISCGDFQPILRCPLTDAKLPQHLVSDIHG